MKHSDSDKPYFLKMKNDLNSNWSLIYDTKRDIQIYSNSDFQIEVDEKSGLINIINKNLYSFCFFEYDETKLSEILNDFSVCKN